MNTLEKFVQQAVKGDKKALEEVVVHIQDMIYNLALRMLWHPEDAKDATQDILIKIITNLGSFKHESAFKTWVYRLSANSLLNFKKKNFKHTLSFDKYEEQLKDGLSPQLGFTSNKAEQTLLIQEAKIGCSHAMLQCLDQASRLAYIIGEVLVFTSQEGAIIMGITPENFRQRLSRSRKKLHNFLQRNCGIVNPKNSCRCFKKVDTSIQKGLINPQWLLFAQEGNSHTLIQEIAEIENEVALYQSNPVYKAPGLLLAEVKRIITSANLPQNG